MVASRNGISRAVATARKVTPAHATSDSSNMSPEHTLNPFPPVAGWRPASTSAFPVATLQVTPSPIFPSARRVIIADFGSLRYRSLIGACNDFNSAAFTKSGSAFCSARFDVLIHAKQIRRIVFRFDLGETFEIVAVSRFHAILAFFHHAIHVGAAG